jgi:hypothetical protein
MQHGAMPIRKRLPWYLWPLVPPVFVVTMVVVGIPLGLLALLSIPYFWLYPERHAHVADLEGTESEKARLRRWRAAYQRMSFIARVRHARKRSRRLRQRRAA